MRQFSDILWNTAYENCILREFKTPERVNSILKDFASVPYIISATLLRSHRWKSDTDFILLTFMTDVMPTWNLIFVVFHHEAFARAVTSSLRMNKEQRKVK